MAIECDGRVRVEARPADCFAVLAKVEGWREWARDLERATVLTRDDRGRAERVNVGVEILGQDYDATVDMAYDEEGHGVSLSLAEAPELSAMAAELRFTPSGAGSAMNFRVGMTLVSPKAPRIERMVSRKIETALTRDLVRHIERSTRQR